MNYLFNKCPMEGGKKKKKLLLLLSDVLFIGLPISLFFGQMSRVGLHVCPLLTNYFFLFYENYIKISIGLCIIKIMLNCYFVFNYTCRSDFI